MIIRVVFDTNVLVSAFVFGGAPQTLFLAAGGGAFPLYSSFLKSELLEVLEERFAWEAGRLRELDRRLTALWTEVEPQIELADCSDSDDNRVLECAVTCGATHIATGDNALLKLDPFRGIRTLRPAVLVAEGPWLDSGNF